MKKQNNFTMLLFLTAFFVVGCSSTSTPEVNPVEIDNVNTINTSTQLKNRLKLFYNEWKGTRYRLGGTTKSGVDCSAFVQTLMAQVFNVNLPRTTASQSQTGSKISRNSAKFGDLVFFKTGRYTRHVGLYLGDGRFMHASTSKGVMISSLSNVYWKKRIWHYRSYSGV